MPFTMKYCTFQCSVPPRVSNESLSWKIIHGILSLSRSRTALWPGGIYVVMVQRGECGRLVLIQNEKPMAFGLAEGFGLR